MKKQVHSFTVFMKLAKFYEGLFDDPKFLEDEDNKEFLGTIYASTLKQLKERGYKIID